MSEVKETTLPGPNGDTAASNSWNKKLSGMSKPKFPERGPNTRKPPRDKAGSLPEGKTFKDNKDDGKDSKKSKFQAIKAAQENKKKSQVQEEEALTAQDLVESIIDRKPGNFMSVFDIIMKDKITDLVADRRVDMINSMFNEQEVEEDVPVDDEEETDDEERIETGEDEPVDAKEAEDEEVNELSPALKNRYANKARLQVKTGDRSQGKKKAKLLQRMKFIKKTNEEEVTDPANNTKPHVFSTKSGNTEKKAHTQETLTRLRNKSVTKTEKSAVKDIG